MDNRPARSELAVWAVFAVGLLVAVTVTAWPAAKVTTGATDDNPMLVGTTTYRGPATALALQQTCSPDPEYSACVTGHLKDLLLARGSVVAFDLLENLTRIDQRIDSDSHPIAHDLGRYAFRVYPTIQDTLAACSYKVFQGCLHGALQSAFDAIQAEGRDIDDDVVRNTCPKPRSSFEEYACLHGLGHGLMLYTNYDLERSLELCDALPTHFAEASCWGGAFMENLVGWIDSQNPTAAGGHDHGHVGPEPEYRVNPDDPHYPCNSVAERYQDSCWQLQTSFILRFNSGSFPQAAQVCNEAGKWSDTCYRSLGRDAGPWAGRDPVQGSILCSHGTERGRALCIRGFVSESIHNDATPYTGIRICAGMPQQDQSPCYDETAGVSRNFLPNVADRRALCDAFPADQRAACKTRAGV